MATYESILALFKKHAQEHILSNWDKLFLDQQEELLDDCSRIDFDWLKARWNEFQNADQEVEAKLEPAPVVRLAVDEAGKEANDEARHIGEDKLRAGKVAAVLVAGGQGSRLGFDGPKGCYPVGPLSGRTLFQWHAEQILASSRRYGVSIPWYIMTSRENDRATRLFFQDNDFFGLNIHDVFFFAQEMVPSIDFQGRLMLATPSGLAMNPNGHGGSLSGLRTSSALKDMVRRGVEYISYFQVDNPLAIICDPLFIGWHVRSAAQMSTKVVEKTSPSERMGVVCLKNGKPSVVEYMDMDDESVRAIDENGAMKFWAGNTAMHVFDVSFVEKVSDGKLPWHQSRKKVAYLAGTRLIRPDQENAVKFETFVFDAMPFAAKTLVLEVRREQEFAPLKNAEGSDSVESCRQLLSNHFCEWLALAGVSVPVAEMNGNGGRRPVVEISPLYSLDAEELAAKVKPEGIKLERSLLLG